MIVWASASVWALEALALAWGGVGVAVAGGCELSLSPSLSAAKVSTGTCAPVSMHVLGASVAMWCGVVVMWCGVVVMWCGVLVVM